MSDKLFGEVMNLPSVQEEGEKTLNEIKQMMNRILKVLGVLRLKVKNNEVMENE